MRILHVSPSVGLARGGSSHAVLELIPALRDQGIQVDLATTDDNGDHLLVVPFEQQTDYHSIPTYFFPKFAPKPRSLREFTFSPGLTRWLWNHIQDYDLVHVHGLFSYPSTIAMAIARLKRVPYINQPHGLLCEWSLQQSRLKKQLFLSLIERANLNHSIALQLTAEKERQEVAQLGLEPDKLILPLGLNPAESIPDARQQLRALLNIPIDQPIILFMSRLHAKKGLEYLIPALSQLRDRPFTFVLAGNGTPEYEAEINQILVQARLEARTYRSGFVTGMQKQLLLQGSDIFALTSHSENFGVVVLEAMAAGLTVVLTPGVALSAMLGEENVGYVSALDVDAIASTIEHCLAHPQQAKAIAQRARHLVLERYTWDSIAKQAIAQYEALLQQSPNSIVAPAHSPTIGL